MTIGYIGLGKMGKNMVLRLLEQGIDVVAWNRSPEPLKEVESAGATAASSLKHLVEILRKRLHEDEDPSTNNYKLSTLIIWLMLPAGSVTDEHIEILLPHLQKGDLLIDGANSNYKDTLRRSKMLKEKGIRFMDVAVSGGPGGARNGACLMIGGDKPDFESLQDLFQAIAAPSAYAYLGRSGAGHFAKMVHNGIEYGMMQAIGEGTAVLKESDFDFDLAEVFRIYNTRSVIESRLVGWAQEALAENPELSGISSAIAHSGEGEWTVEAAKKLKIKVPIIEESLNVRKRSGNEPENFSNKVVTALRGKFGGHKTS